MLLLQLFIIPENFICGTVVLHQNNLKIGVSGFLINRFHTLLQLFFVVFIGDNHGNQRLSLNGKLCAVPPPVLCHRHLSLYAQSVIMGLYSSTAGFIGIHLTFRISCR